MGNNKSIYIVMHPNEYTLEKTGCEIESDTVIDSLALAKPEAKYRVEERRSGSASTQVMDDSES